MINAKTEFYLGVMNSRITFLNLTVELVFQIFLFKFHPLLRTKGKKLKFINEDEAMKITQLH